MLQAAIQGILLGLLLSVLIGPVFFLLIQTSLNEGFKQAMYLEAGIFLSDGFCIWLSYLGLANLFKDPVVANYFGIAGGSFLIFTGVKTFFKKHIERDKEGNVKHTPPFQLGLKGFFFNMSNPSVILFWLGAVGIAVSQFGSDKLTIFVYFSGTLITVLAIDILKAFGAQKIRHYLTPAAFIRINQVSGTLIFAFGLFLLSRVVLSLLHLTA